MVYLYYINKKGETMKILTFANPKGGAGKTVSSINFAYALSRLGYKTLLIDTDPRGGVSICLGVENQNTLFDLIKEYNEGFVENIEKYKNHKNGVDIIISDYEIAKFDSYFASDTVSATFIIKNLISEFFNAYDYIVIDTEGTVNSLTASILYSTQDIFIPTQASNLDLTGVRDIMGLVKNISRQNADLKIRKVFLIRAKMNTIAFKEFQNSLESFFDEQQFSKVAIRENQDIINAVNSQLDIFSYKNTSNGAIDYRNLVYEYIDAQKEI